MLCDFPQSECMNVKRTTCTLLGRGAASDVRQEFGERRTRGESICVNELTILVMDGEQRFEAPNEPVRSHQKAPLQLVSDGGSIDESLETLLGVNSIRWIERVPHISQCEERWCAFKASRVPKTTPGPVFGSRHHPRGNPGSV